MTTKNFMDFSIGEKRVNSKFSGINPMMKLRRWLSSTQIASVASNSSHLVYVR